MTRPQRPLAVRSAFQEKLNQPQPMTLWHQLSPQQQRQLAQLLAHLIRRLRQTSPSQEESDHEQR